jgi:hypothetical protein
MKMEYANNAGITLIPIPFWWDGSLSTLAATLHQHRPDIPLSSVFVNAKPISQVMPLKHQQRVQYKPSIPQHYSDTADPSSWCVLYYWNVTYFT